MVWQQKREVYFNISKRSMIFKNALVGARSAHAVYQEDLQGHSTSENLEIAFAQAKTGTIQYVEAQRQFLDLLVEAQML